MTKREIDICICTFQRPHIVQTLQSLAQMNVESNWKISIIIADNDETPSSQESIEKAAKDTPFKINYIHAPARNISIARNACLDHAKAPLVAFIDDDEIVDKNWLIELVKRLDDTDAQAVIGPVYVIYPEECPQWMIDGNYHARAATYVNGEIITGYTANVIFDQTAESFKDRRFRLELGTTGGEDSTFLKEAYMAGAKIEYAANAIVTEEIPIDRTTISWMLKRRFREGQTHGLMLQEANKMLIANVKNIVLAAAKSLISLVASPLFILQKHRFYFWIFRASMHAGVVSHLLGKATLIQYGQEPEKDSKQ